MTPLSIYPYFHSKIIKKQIKMTTRIHQSPNVNWVYYGVTIIICAVFFQTFSESLCNLSNWFSETCAARVAAVKP